MAAPGYPREHVDALLAGIRAEMATRADLATLRSEMTAEFGKVRTEMAELRGELRTDMATMEGRLTARIEGLRSEWKVWMLVLGAVLAVVSSGVGNRVLNLLWPAGPTAPPASFGLPLQR